MIVLELCLKRSIGDRFYAPQIVERWEVENRKEADQAIAKERPNGFYVREAK